MTRILFGGQAALLLAALCPAAPAAAAPAAAASTPPGPSLPAPADNPLRIDFARDPFLRFVDLKGAPMPFRETVSGAVAAYPAVEAAIATQSETVAVKTEVRSAVFPNLDANVVAGRSLARNLDGDKVFVERLSPTQRSDAYVAADQLIYDFGATTARINAASARIKAAENEVARAASETALRAVNAWYDVFTYQTLVALNASTVTRYRQILSDTRDRFQRGVGTGSDVARAEAFLATAEVQGVAFQRRLDQARGTYRQFYGVEAPARLGRPDAPTSAATSVEAARQLSRNAPPVAVAEALASAAQQDVRASRGDALPRLGARITGNLYDLAGSADNYDVRGELLLRYQFATGGAQSARVEQARARLKNRQFDTERVALESERDATVAFNDIALLEANVVTLRDAYQANRVSRDMFFQQFLALRGTQLDLLDAEQDFFRSAADYLQGAVELDIARYVLLARTGELLPTFGIQLSSHELNR